MFTSQNGRHKLSSSFFSTFWDEIKLIVCWIIVLLFNKSVYVLLMFGRILELRLFFEFVV